MSKIIEFFLPRIPFYRKPAFSLDTDRENSLSFLLNSMTFRGIEFDPLVAVEGEEVFGKETVFF